MSSQLALYNKALLLCGERSLSTVSDAVESRRLLDVVWNNGGVNECLSEAQWNFAMRAVEITYDTSITTSFGYSRAFGIPTDFVVLSAMCSDERFRSPVLGYVEEAGYWYSDYDTMYVRYVSNDVSYGGDLSAWPAPFDDFAAAHFATKIVRKLTDDQTTISQFINLQAPSRTIRGQALKEAKSRNAMGNPTQMIAQGNWTKSRLSGGRRRDNGSYSNLTG